MAARLPRVRDGTLHESTNEPSCETIEYLYHHVFLPPKLPQQDDFRPHLESALLNTTIDGLVNLLSHLPDSRCTSIKAAISMLRNMRNVHSPGETVTEMNLLKALKDLPGVGASIPLHIRAQNAGVLISKAADCTRFDLFELSPSNAAVMTTKGRLRRSFPGEAISISTSVIYERGFCDTVAHTLSSMSAHAVAGMQPQVRKAGDLMDEDRDTTHPGMVTELFAGFLTSVGQPLPVPEVLKNTREEVFWDSTRSPWHRSASWLLIRVALQLMLTRATGSDTAYKESLLFLMGYIQNLALQHASSPSDMLYAMNAKLARRSLKLGSLLHGSIGRYVEETIQATTDSLAKRWSDIQEQETPPIDLSLLKKLNFRIDAGASAPGLDRYIESLSTRQISTSSEFFEPTSSLIKYPADQLPSLPSGGFSDHSYAIANLQGFETWVASHCRPWTAAHNSNEDTCVRLYRVIKAYHSLATYYYSANPEALSIMLLTIFEIWVACDEAAVTFCPLLGKYDPGLQQDVLQNLLLPFRGQMERLRLVEAYLTERCHRARFPSSKLYLDLNSPDSFAVRYFDASMLHQSEQQRIKDLAHQERQAKVSELHRLKQQYAAFMNDYTGNVCEKYEVVVDLYNNFTEWRHSPDCKSCASKKKAEQLKIEIHEWPLPQAVTKAKAVVFELRVPNEFASWRDATFYLFGNVLKAGFSMIRKPRATYPLSADLHLRSASTIATSQRVVLLSQDKPHYVTHRKNQKVSTAYEDTVCLQSGLNYQYYDVEEGSFVDTIIFSEQFARSCTYQLPARSLTLSKYLFRPAKTPDGLTPNDVVAHQFECPSYMAIEEFRYLSTLPFGHLIQWYNILTELAAPSVDFKRDETALFMFQCIYQAGPPNATSLRASHAVASDDSFACALLETLNNALQRVKENWESAAALGAFSAIAGRVLSLNSSAEIHDRCLMFLRMLRQVAFGWVELLRTKGQQAVKDEDRTEFRRKSADVALICALCFDVDDEYLAGFLGDRENGSIFVQCAMAVQEGKRTYPLATEPVFALLQHRFRKLLFRTYPILNGKHLDDAIQKSWSSYRSGSGWKVVSSKKDHWLVTRMETSGNADTLTVHFNLLDGELLVNGLPQDRPPREYEQHPLWSTLFGHSAVEVMPTTDAGMQFSAKREFEGHEVHIGFDEFKGSRDLVIRASVDSTVYETVPARLLDGLFPDFFVCEFVHWINHADGTIQLRPRNRPWDRFAPAAWTLSKSPQAPGWHLMKGDETVVPLKSKTASTVGTILSPLALPSEIHVILQASQEVVEVELPRLQLGFSLEFGGVLLKSREFRGTSVDRDQSLGTLIGLSNRLVLSSGNGNRLALVPEGLVSYTSNGGHVHVGVDRSSITKVHPLRVNGRLGMFDDNGSLQGKFFLAYLHALTTFCLPDPFTHKTGTEQALSILRSAAVRSFDHLSGSNVETLLGIARLTPTRCFYPANERVMQTVSWSHELNFLAQHNHFHEEVVSIFDQATRSAILYPDSDYSQPDTNTTNSYLRDRDSVRSSTFRISGFGAEDHQVLYDSRYEARDGNHNTARASFAHILSSLVSRGSESRHYDTPSAEYLWKALCSSSIVHGAHRKQALHLRFSATLVHSGLDVSLWLPLHKLLGNHNLAQVNKYEVMMWLSTLAAAKDPDMQILQTLAFFFTAECLREVTLPSIQSCLPAEGHKPTPDWIRPIVRSHLVKLRDSPEATLPKLHNEDFRRFNSRRDRLFSDKQDEAVGHLVNKIWLQWPRETLSAPDLSAQPINVSDYVHVDQAVSAVAVKFKRWFENLQLFDYLRQVQRAASGLGKSKVSMPQWLTAATPTVQRCAGFISPSHLFAGPAPTLPTLPNSPPLLQPSIVDKDVSPRLTALIQALRGTSGSNPYETSYIDDLHGSLMSLKAQNDAASFVTPSTVTQQYLLDYSRSCTAYADTVYHSLVSAVNLAPISLPQCINSSSACAALQWPRVSPAFFLRQMNRESWRFLPEPWKPRIVQYGLALTASQKADRTLNSARLSSPEDLINEIKNIGHTNWDPLQFPETLLLEVESGIVVREVQEQIAAEMRTPGHGGNVVMQLNMGEGKSSVIVPMVGAALADSSKLVRVVVAKPQSKQMAQMLIAKLGGLLGRQVYYMPFSRALKLNENDAKIIDRMLRECMSSGGILLIQPEHILSFQLMGVECYNAGKESVGRVLLRTQDFFDTTSRDIIDESDETYNCKLELIYTMGTQRPIEHSPNRWVCIQQVLNLVRELSTDVGEAFPSSLEFNDYHNGGFARLRVLKSDVEEVLLARIAGEICETGLDGFPIARQSGDVRHAVFVYLTKFDLSIEEIKLVEGAGTGGFFTPATKMTLLLLRGLLAGGVLAFAFGQKRWRVNYGLVDTRSPATKLTVPYRAKDNPAPRAEFSHPDVVLVLTSLCYYYGGLADEDLFAALEHLMDSDQAQTEYQAWIQDSPGMATAFRQLEGINLRDRPQCEHEVFPALRFGKSVIDYFLSHIVFPKEMKEFPRKLSASGWDIGKMKTYPTTGFSGTNDAQKLLPLDVKHLDLPRQKHTNALVLEYLLQPENGVVLPTTRADRFDSQADRSNSDAEHLLTTVIGLDPPIQAILDVGAQILELNNLQVAQKWLEMCSDHHFKAVVFVNEDDELSVVDRNGRIESLQTSSFSAQLDICLVFLDEAHTRGIDLKLPKHYRAAVTLGASLTKDRLVQACMRMRKLGKGQTVVFYITEEIKNKIRACTLKSPSETIEVQDVLHWAISETFVEVCRAIPLWAVQGQRFLRQSELWNELKTNGVTTMSQPQSEKFLEEEAQTLEHRYLPRYSNHIGISQLEMSTAARVHEVEDRCREFENLQFNSSTLQEEQERELSPEIEQERQVQRPAPAQAREHFLSHHVWRFVSEGVVTRDTEAYMPAFSALHDTSAATGFPLAQLAGDRTLLVTADFVATVQKSGSLHVSDSYQRPVQWILTCRSSKTNAVTHIMIISPFEAQQLLPIVRSAKTVAMHLYKPRCNKSHPSFDRLDFFTIPEQFTSIIIPRSLIVQLDLFAGQLYIGSYDDYVEVCNFIGLATDTPKGNEEHAVDGFILRDADGHPTTRVSPVNFLQVLASKVRRSGQRIANTDVGRLLGGKILRKSDFEE